MPPRPPNRAETPRGGPTLCVCVCVCVSEYVGVSCVPAFVRAHITHRHISRSSPRGRTTSA